MTLALVVGLLFGAAAAPERPTLTGIVKGAKDRPLSGAVIFIYTARPRTGTSTTCPSCYLDCRKRAQTSANGQFAIPSVDPALLFRVGATAEGYLASFRENVDPAAGPITITLAAQPSLPDNPRRVLRAQVRDADGAPVFGALVEATGYEISTPGGWQRTFGSIGVDPTITGMSGTFSLALPLEVDSLFLEVEALGLAPKVFGRVPTGLQENVLRLGPGRSIKGRMVQGGRPVSGAVVGTAQVSRNSETFVGERTAETDTSGRFLLLNLPPDEKLVVYGKLEGLGGRGAMAEREIEGEDEGRIRDLGDMALEPGITLSGRVVLADGKPVPPHTRIAVDRMRAWDRAERELAPDGSFRFGPLPRETLSVSIRLPGYELSRENESLLPEHGDPRQSLAGRLDQDTQLGIVLEPAGARTPAQPPRSAEEWRALNAQQDAVRSKPLRGAPPSLARAGSDDADAFWALMQEVERLGHQNQHRAAMAILEKARRQYPDREFEIGQDLAFSHAHLGQYEKSMEIWKKGHAKGLFYGLMPVFDWLNPFRELPQFQSLVDRDSELREEATRVAKMRYETILPSGYSDARKYPLFIVLHGGAESIERAKRYWGSRGLTRGYLVAFLQSFRHVGSGTYTWQSQDQEARVGIRTLYEEIRQKLPVDTSRVLIGGMSAGGMMSLDVVFHDVIPVTGFVVNCPVVPADFETGMADEIRKRGIGGIVITGEKDWSLPRQKEMIDAFSKAGVRHRFTVIPGMGHEIPGDFADRLDAALGELETATLPAPNEVPSPSRISGAAADEKDFDARWREAEQNVMSGPGQRYFSNVFFKEFFGKYSTHINECAQQTGERMTADLRAAVELGASGQVLTVMVRPRSKPSTCFEDLVKRDTFSRPPSDPFWIPLEIRFSKPWP